MPIGLLNTAFSLSSLFLAGFNGYNLSRYLEEYTLLASILTILYSVAGALVVSNSPRNPLGWIFLAVGFSQSLAQFAATYAEYALVTNPRSSLPGGLLMPWLGALIWVPGLSLAITFVSLLFPDGRLASRRWRPLAGFIALSLAIFVVLQTYVWPYRGRIPPPQFGGIVGSLFGMLFPLTLVCGLACVGSLVYRYRRAAGRERQQIKWFAYTTGVFLAAIAVTGYLPVRLLTYLPFLPAASLVPLAVSIAILRYRIYNIDIIINRTLVYGSADSHTRRDPLQGRSHDPDTFPRPHRPAAAPTYRGGLHACDRRPV